MITRYALGPRITVIGRERVKQGLKSSVAAKCAFSPGGRTKGPRGRDRGFHGFVRRQQRGRRVCPAARPPPRRGHAVPQTGSLSRARCRLSRQRPDRSAGTSSEAAPPRSSCFPGSGSRGPDPGAVGPEAASGPWRVQSRPRRAKAAALHGRVHSPGVHVAQDALRAGKCRDTRGGWPEATPGLCGEEGPAERQCEARPPGTVTAACSRGRGRSVPRRPAGVHVKTRFLHLDGNKAGF